MAQFKLILSDLHIGAGQGNPLEDFTLDGALAGLLSEWAQESERSGVTAELILAGDTFEFLQVPALADQEAFDPTAAYPPERFVPSDEVSAVAKMHTILAGHAELMAALAAWLAEVPARRTLTLIKGNHDLELHWRSVQEVLRTALGADGPRASLLRYEERRISRQGLYVEHGNQYTESASRVADMTEPHDLTTGEGLLWPVGSRFVARLLNQIEHERYWVDSVKPVTALVWYLLSLDTPLGLRALSLLLSELPDILLTADSRMLLTDAGADLLAAPGSPGTADALQRRIAQALAPLGLPSAALEATTAEATVLGWGELALRRGQAEEQAQRDALKRVAALKSGQERARVVVFGHTHAACQVPLPDGAAYCNAGTWTWRRDLAGADAKTWRELFEHPERYTHLIQPTYVRVDYDAQDQPQARLCTVSLPSLEGSWWSRLRSWWSRGR
jgi:UDP-2,3-diacylglucosamine pyrophosphatase LpxH